MVHVGPSQGSPAVIFGVFICSSASDGVAHQRVTERKRTEAESISREENRQSCRAEDAKRNICCK